MDALLPELAKLGLPGLFIGYLIWQNNRLAERLDKANQTIVDLQDKRIAESKEQGDIIRGNMTALQTFNDQFKAAVNVLGALLQRSKGS